MESSKLSPNLDPAIRHCVFTDDELEIRLLEAHPEDPEGVDCITITINAGNCAIAGDFFKTYHFSSVIDDDNHKLKLEWVPDGSQTRNGALVFADAINARLKGEIYLAFYE